jgi:2'-5' RNA ligase
VEYEISIRITFPEKISKALKLEKDRFVAEYGSGYKSEPHITLYLDSYTREGFPQLLHDLRELRVQPFTIALLKPKAIFEEDRHRNLYVMDVSNKEQLWQLHAKVSEIAIPYRSPLLREKTRQRLERQGIHTDGTRESLNAHKDARAIEMFDPHITLGEIDLDKPQADIAEVRKNLKQIEGEAIAVSSIVVFFYGREDNSEKAKLIDEVAISFQS